MGSRRCRSRSFSCAKHFPKAQRVSYARRARTGERDLHGRRAPSPSCRPAISPTRSRRTSAVCAPPPCAPHAVPGSTLRLGVAARQGYEGTAERAPRRDRRHGGRRHAAHRGRAVLGVCGRRSPRRLRGHAGTRAHALPRLRHGHARRRPAHHADAGRGLLPCEPSRAAVARSSGGDGGEAAGRAAARLLGQLAGGIAHDFNNLVDDHRRLRRADRVGGVGAADGAAGRAARSGAPADGPAISCGSCSTFSRAPTRRAPRAQPARATRPRCSHAEPAGAGRHPHRARPARRPAMLVSIDAGQLSSRC